MKQKNIGSSADSWLKEEGIREEISATSRKRVSERRMIKSATPDDLVVLSTSETRRALSPTHSAATLHAGRRSPDKRVLGQDTITRISLLVGIYKALHTYFGDAGDYWLTHPDDSPLFGGAIPIDYMVATGLEGMNELRRMLDGWTVGQ